MRNVLVTGAEGLAASHLLPLLRREGGARIFGTSLVESGVDRLVDRAYRVDILDRDSIRKVVRESTPDHVYHFAAVVPVSRVNADFAYALRVNVEGTYNLLESISEVAPLAKVLIAGSSEEYGARGREDMPLTETDVFSPTNAYGVTKVAQELLARLSEKGKGMRIFFTRTFNLTGPGQSPEFVCSSFAQQVALCRLRGTGTIRVGNLDVERDFLDIRDVVRAYRTIMEKGTLGLLYNVCSGEPVSLLRILDTLRSLAGVPIAIEQDEKRVRKVDIPYVVGSNKRLCGLGWERTFTMEETLRDLLNYWDDRCLEDQDRTGAGPGPPAAFPAR